MNLDRIKPLNNHVLVEVGELFNETFQYKSLKLHVNTSYYPERHLNVKVTVRRVPDRLKVITNSGETMDWGTEVEVAPGDEVIVDYYGLMMNLGNVAHKANEFSFPKYIYEDGVYYVFLHYRDFFMRIKDEYPLNGYVLLKPDPEPKEEVLPSGIIMLPKVKRGKQFKFGTVIKSGRPNDWYRGMEIKDSVIKDGSRVAYAASVYRTFENEYHETITKGTIAMQQRSIHTAL